MKNPKTLGYQVEISSAYGGRWYVQYSCSDFMDAVRARDILVASNRHIPVRIIALQDSKK